MTKQQLDKINAAVAPLVPPGADFIVIVSSKKYCSHTSKNDGKTVLTAVKAFLETVRNKNFIKPQNEN